MAKKTFKRIVRPATAEERKRHVKFARRLWRSSHPVNPRLCRTGLLAFPRKSEPRGRHRA